MPDPADSPPSVPGSPASVLRRRRRVRLGLRVLAALVLVLGAELAYLARLVRVQREAVAAIVATGGNVLYDWEAPRGRPINRRAEPGAPRWLVRALGWDWFGPVVVVHLGPTATDATMLHVGRLPRLTALIVPRGAAMTDAGAADLAGLVDLEQVNLGGTRITGAALRSLAGATNLAELSLAGTTIRDRDCATIATHRGLERLDLARTAITDVGLAHLARLPNLQALRLGRTAITGAGLGQLATLDDLVDLRLPGTNVADLASFPPLPRLRRLDLADCPLTDAGLVHLRAAVTLKDVDLRGTRVTPAGLDSLRKARPELKINWTAPAGTEKRP